jgi:hypothetical protein
MYTVVGPAGNVSLATAVPAMRTLPANLKIPNNFKNINKRLLSSKNAWTANTSNMLNNIRNKNWRNASRSDIIKFIMYGYYGLFHRIKFFGEENAKDDLAKFHHKYAIVSNRNPLNQSMIPPRFLWRRLQTIDDDRFLLSLAKIVEW